MAEANEKLMQQMEEAPAGCFDIENVEEAQKVIEMVRETDIHKTFGRAPLSCDWVMKCMYLSCSQDVALVELSGSESSEDESDLSDSESSDSDDENEITEQNLKLPGDKSKKQKPNIQVLDPQTK